MKIKNKFSELIQQKRKTIEIRKEDSFDKIISKNVCNKTDGINYYQTTIFKNCQLSINM
ncbi:MAG: hypothetical protein OHM56_02355 [Spiroplasma phoeniceum]|nr:MAG: hypothetical protein OHM57_01800 [Spiroplasma phoeniceum]UZQ32819.1 MAG: hypothetical protein OHM56_02355 [Spiroplasma phoeniceum]